MKNLSKIGIALFVFSLLVSAATLFSNPIIDQTKGLQSSLSSAGSMEGITLERTRVYNTVALPEPKAVLWQSERLFTFHREQRYDINGGPSYGIRQTDYNSSDPIFSDGIIYFTVSVSDGNLFAIDAATGKLRTGFKLKATGLSAPAVVGDLVYLGAEDGNLMALSRTDSKVRWAIAKKGYRFDVVSPFVANGLAYFGGAQRTATNRTRGEGVVAAVDASTGEAKWVFPTKGNPTSAAISGETMIFGDEDSHVFAVDSKTGAQKWTFKADDQVGSPAILGDSVYFSDIKGRLYAVGVATGDQKWKTDKNVGIRYELAVDNGTVYGAGGDKSGQAILAFESATGKEKWRFKSNSPCGPPIIAGGTVYFFSQNKNLFSLDATDGRLRWKYKMPHDTYASPIISNGVAYILDDEWYVSAIK